MTAGDAAMIIVGAGQAGGRAALTLREAGHTGTIVLLGSESSAPYERPPLSPRSPAQNRRLDRSSAREQCLRWRPSLSAIGRSFAKWHSRSNA
jgi:NADPH-dependent 2,4-dienoyl-CoA reductase/sulfur reductase-like enzyme